MADNADNNVTENNNNTDNMVLLAQSFDKAWNSHDVDEVMTFFPDDAVVRTVPPLPGGPEEYRGPQQIREWVQSLISGFHVESGDHQVKGDEITWLSTIRSDGLRQLGLGEAEGTADVLVDGSKIREFHFTFSAETQERMRRSGQGES